MAVFIRNRAYQGRVQAVILDWAGTAVDYGSIGPAAVFVEVFRQFGVTVTVEEARRFMGVEKKEHIRRMCALPSVAAQWRAARGREPDENDVAALYEKTEPMMMEALAGHSDLIPGLLSTVDDLRGDGVRIGSTTGYTAPMMAVLAPAARDRGYRPDAVVCSSDVPAGRPFPWMCYRNAIELQVYPMEAVVKVGDTVADIQEGLNAGMWTVGVTRSGNELGLTEAEAGRLAPGDLHDRLSHIEQRFRDAGAHFVCEGVWDLLPVIGQVNERLGRGEGPLI